MRDRMLKRKLTLRSRRKKRVRGAIEGIPSKPRISIFRSNRYFYAQAIDDQNGVTLACADGAKLKVGNNKDDVKKVANELVAKLKEKSIDSVVFDRNGYLYHGVVASFADELRALGLKF